MMASTLRLTEQQYAELGRAQQLALPGVQPRRRRETMTVAELRRDQPEKDIRTEILKACRMYPAIAWIERCEPFKGYVMPFPKFKALAAALRKQAQWTPAAVLKLLNQFLVVREFAKPDMADLIGQLRIGPLVAIEVKKVGEKTTAGQSAFLDTVTRAGGCACVARDAASAIERIESFIAARQQEQS